MDHEAEQPGAEAFSWFFSCFSDDILSSQTIWHQIPMFMW